MPVAAIPKKNLETLLLDNQLLTHKQIEQAKKIAADQKVDLFNTILDQNMMSETDLLTFLSQILGIPFEEIDRATVDFKIANLIPESFAKERYILPLFQLGNVLTVAICNPFDLETIEQLEMISDLTINPILTARDNIYSLFGYCYSFVAQESGEEANVMANLFEMGMKLMGDSGSDDMVYDLAQEAPIAKLVDTIVKQAIEEKASDIHIEPDEKVIKIRFRVDGLLKDVMSPPKKLEAAIVSRIKILANMDITENRKPQDGRMTISLKEKDIDFRVSTIRTISGEKVVMRVLDKSGTFVSSDKLGMSVSDNKRYVQLINSTSGIVIVCGPTGSGKTSTLYAALAQINSPEKNIITIEDPVEYNLEGINQIPVNPKIGVDFVNGLKSIVRQDPDVIMVGEVRDFETASIAIQAALTGHMVFTTLHTRNAPSAITRLIDMGVQPFLLTSSVNGVMGQRLVRTICPNCRVPAKVADNLTYKETVLMEELAKIAKKEIKLFKGSGCKFCDNSGYKGRTGIFEIMVLNDEIRELALNKSSSDQLLYAALKSGMVPMKDDGLLKVLDGQTTIEEIARVLDI